MRQRKASGGIPSKYLLMILSIVCIMLLFFSYSTGFTGGPIESLANHIFIPMQKGIDYIGSSIAISSADTKTAAPCSMQRSTRIRLTVFLNASFMTHLPLLPNRCAGAQRVRRRTLSSL